MKKIYKEFLENEKFTTLQYDEIIEKLDELNITVIQIGEKGYYGVGDNVVEIERTDYEHPLTLEKTHSSGNILYIDPEWYASHKKEIDYLVNYISSNTPLNKLDISSCFITPQVIDSLCGNKKLEEVGLGLYSDVYSLSREEYLKFKNSSIKKVATGAVDSELAENFDSIIYYNTSKKLIGYYGYDKLHSDKEVTIYLDKKLTDEEIFNLKYASSNITIQLQEDAMYDVFKVCVRLVELGLNTKVVLKSDNKKIINNILFDANIKYNNLYIAPNYYPLKYDKYLRLEKVLYSMVESAKDLSPFEKYIYAYNIAKKYKKYKEVPEGMDASESRNLNFILDNEYMVCVGFSSLFGDLLDKLGINNMELGVSVDVSYDNPDLSKIQTTEFGGHSRRYVNIVDPKYGIDGFYVADPTWDNDMENDTYNYLAITDDEASHSRRYIQMDWFKELFNVTNKEEFYKKINILIDKEKNSLFKVYESPKDVAYYLIERIQVLDHDFVNSLKEKYEYIGLMKYQYPDDVGFLLSDIGDYIISKVNKPLSGKTIFSAVENVYRTLQFFPEDRIDIELENMKTATRERQESAFPKRNKEYEDGRVENYENPSNKFDDEQQKSL